MMDQRLRSAAGRALAARYSTSPVLPTVVGLDSIAPFVNSGAGVCTLNRIPLKDIGAVMSGLHAGEREAIVNIDSINGITRDRSALDFLRECGVSGIMSSRLAILQFARERGFFTVQSLFLGGASNIPSNTASIDSSRPHLVHVNPAPVLPYLTAEELQRFGPYFASGFVATTDDVRAAVRAGALGVATSNPRLWGLTRAELGPVTAAPVS